MVESEEEDYMSDAFLRNDTKPGLMPKIILDKHKRKESAFKKSTQKTKPVKVVEAEKRNEKLETALDESNKGFAMLSKMGFKKGMGLGKEGQGISDPIRIEIKAGRKGLGKEAEEQQRKKKRHQAYVIMAKRKRVVEENLKGDFKNRMRNKISERQNLSDFYKSQKACEQLDSKKNIDIPENSWFWPKAFKEEEEEEEEIENEADKEDDDDTEDIASKLEKITEYLRRQHLYCIWCGTAYNDAGDLEIHCPGNTFSTHDE